jgi:hypothetical protein
MRNSIYFRALTASVLVSLLVLDAFTTRALAQMMLAAPRVFVHVLDVMTRLGT